MGTGAAATISLEQTCYASGANGSYSQVSGDYYTFIMGDASCGSNTYDIVFQTTAAPISVSSVTQNPVAGYVFINQPVVVTANLSGSLPTARQSICAIH